MKSRIIVNQIKCILGVEKPQDDLIQINMIIGAITKFFSMLVSYAYVPVVLSYLGVEKYGVWATILSILSWIGYFDIGIGNGLRNKLTESITRSETLESRILISSAYAFIAFIMLFAMAVFFVIAQFLNWNSVFGVNNFDEDLKWIVCICVSFVSINFILSICNNIFFALQKAMYVSIMGLLTQVLNLVAVLVISHILKNNLLLMAIIYGLSMVSVSMLFNIILWTSNPNLRPSLSMVRMKQGKRLTNLGLQFFVVQICALVLFTTDNLIISNLYGASNVTPYTTVNKLFMVFSQGFTAILAPIWSSVTKAKTEGSYAWIKSLIKKLHRIMIPFAIGITILTIVFKPLSLWWLGQELIYPEGLVMLGAIYSFLTIWCNTYAYISNGLELMKVSMTFAVIQAMVNIPFSLFFAISLGMESTGILLGTVLATAIGGITGPYYVRKEIKKYDRC